MAKKFWLIKSEPEEFSIADFANETDRTTYWDGVRNYQARNFIRDDMKKGDGVLFYQSNTDPLAIVGTCTVVKEAYPDHTSFDPDSKHFDAGTTVDNPRWFMVDIKLASIFKHPVSLDELRKHDALRSLRLLQRGNRLSVMPVTKEEYDYIIKLSKG